MVFKLNREQQVVVLEKMLCNRFADCSSSLKALIEPKLRHLIRVTSPVQIESSMVRHPLSEYFSQSIFKSVKLVNVFKFIELVFRCTLVEILAVRTRHTHIPLEPDQFRARYTNTYANFFDTANDREKELIGSFIWYTNIAKDVIDPAEQHSKQKFLDIVCRLTGSTTRIVTGDTPCLFSLRRMIIFEIETGVLPEVRQRQRNKRVVPISDEEREVKTFQWRIKKLSKSAEEPDQDPLPETLIKLSDEVIARLSVSVHEKILYTHDYTFTMSHSHPAPVHCEMTPNPQHYYAQPLPEMHAQEAPLLQLQQLEVVQQLCQQAVAALPVHPAEHLLEDEVGALAEQIDPEALQQCLYECNAVSSLAAVSRKRARKHRKQSRAAASVAELHEWVEVMGDHTAFQNLSSPDSSDISTVFDEDEVSDLDLPETQRPKLM